MASKKLDKTIVVALKDLYKERDVVAHAIAQLEALLPGNSSVAKNKVAPPKKRGRPSKASSLTAAASESNPKIDPKSNDDAHTPRSTWSPLARRQASQRMRAYWAKRREATQKATAKSAAKRGRRA